MHYLKFHKLNVFFKKKGGISLKYKVKLLRLGGAGKQRIKQIELICGEFCCRRIKWKMSNFKMDPSRANALNLMEIKVCNYSKRLLYGSSMENQSVSLLLSDGVSNHWTHFRTSLYNLYVWRVLDYLTSLRIINLDPECYRTDISLIFFVLLLKNTHTKKNLVTNQKKKSSILRIMYKNSMHLTA